MLNVTGLDMLLPQPLQLRRTAAQKREDRILHSLGVLDARSLVAGQSPLFDPVEVRVARLVDDHVSLPRELVCDDPSLFTHPKRVKGVLRDLAFGGMRRQLVSVSRQHNLRTTMGRDQWQRAVMVGTIQANAEYATVAGNATATSATSLTAATGFPTTGGPTAGGGLQGQIVVALPNNSGVGTRGYGVIMSNSATVLTIDQWYDPTSTTGAALGTPPNATANYLVLPTGAAAKWMGLCATGGTGTPPTGGHAPAAGDVLRTADGLFADGTTSAAATEQSANGLARAFVNPTFAAGNYQLQNTWTYTGSTLVSIDVVVMCNSKAAAGSLLFLETVLNATASLNTNGDTCQVTWTVTL